MGANFFYIFRGTGDVGTLAPCTVLDEDEIAGRIVSLPLNMNAEEGRTASCAHCHRFVVGAGEEGAVRQNPYLRPCRDEQRGRVCGLFSGLSLDAGSRALDRCFCSGTTSRRRPQGNHGSQVVGLRICSSATCLS